MLVSPFLHRRRALREALAERRENLRFQPLLRRVQRLRLARQTRARGLVPVHRRGRRLAPQRELPRAEFHELGGGPRDVLGHHATERNAVRFETGAFQLFFIAFNLGERRAERVAPRAARHAVALEPDQSLALSELHELAR